MIHSTINFFLFSLEGIFDVVPRWCNGQISKVLFVFPFWPGCVSAQSSESFLFKKQCWRLSPQVLRTPARFFVSDAHLLSFLLSIFATWVRKWKKSLRRLPLSRVTKTIVASWHCHPESFCASGKFLRVTLESAWEVSRWSGKFLDGPDIFRMVRKVSG